MAKVETALGKQSTELPGGVYLVGLPRGALYYLENIQRRLTLASASLVIFAGTALSVLQACVGRLILDEARPLHDRCSGVVHPLRCLSDNRRYGLY